MKLHVWLLPIAVGLLVTGCGHKLSDGDRAQGFAMEACGIERTEDGSLARGEDGKVRVDTAGSGSFSLDTESIDDLISKQDYWDSRSKAAQAAAQLDSKWQALAEATIGPEGLLSEWIRLRKQGLNPYTEISTINRDIDQYNSQLHDSSAICGGLALQLESE